MPDAIEAAAARIENGRPQRGYSWVCNCSVCSGLRSGKIPAIDPARLARALHDSQPCPLRRCADAMACPRLPFLTDWARKAIEWTASFPLVPVAGDQAQSVADCQVPGQVSLVDVLDLREADLAATPTELAA